MRDIICVEIRRKKFKNGCLLFRVSNPIEAQPQGKIFENLSLWLDLFLFVKIFILHAPLETTSNDGASKRPRPRGRTIRKNVRGRQSEADEREGWENVGVILRVRENGEEDDVDDEDSTNWNDVDGEPFE